VDHTAGANGGNEECDAHDVDDEYQGRKDVLDAGDGSVSGDQ
jgi:hypothetical protein